MNIDIRENIINNFKNNSKEEIKRAIDESIKEHDEIVLPGLGVFLEIIWNNSNEELKEKLISILEKNINK